jgi:hypothetical protein
MSRRQEQIERAFRNMMHKKLLELLEIMNPQERIEWGALPYTELVIYAHRLLDKEVKYIVHEATKPSPLNL